MLWRSITVAMAAPRARQVRPGSGQMRAPPSTSSARGRRNRGSPCSERALEPASRSPSRVKRPVAGVLLNAPYASVRRLFELRGPPLPYRLLLTDQFNSEALIGGIGVPVMILHGTADENIPVTEARRLYAAAREPKIMIEVEGAGHLAAWEGGAKATALRAARLLDREAPGALPRMVRLTVLAAAEVARHIAAPPEARSMPR